MSDEELIEKYRQGDEEAFREIYNKYVKIIAYYARNMYICGGDWEDLIQEGLFGFTKAINTYKSGDASFATYAGICIKSSLNTAIKKYSYDKLNPISRNFPVITDDFANLSIYEPEEAALMRELGNELKEEIMNLLSKYEVKILSLYLGGKSYEDIGKELGKSAKSVDNALFRIRTKVKAYLTEKKG